MQPKQVTIREKKANFQLEKPQMALANPSLSAHLLFIMILSQKEHLARSVCRLNLCALGNFRPAMHTEKGFPSCGLWAASWVHFAVETSFVLYLWTCSSGCCLWSPAVSNMCVSTTFGHLEGCDFCLVLSMCRSEINLQVLPTRKLD